MRNRLILSSKHLAPLVEIIIAVVFFAGVSTILVQVFATAHNNSRFAHDINNATLFVSECAERIRTSDSYDAFIDALHQSGFHDGDNDNAYYAYLDASFSPTSRDFAYTMVTFEASVKDSEAGRLVSGQFVCVRRDGNELIRMDTAVFLPRST